MFERAGISEVRVTSKSISWVLIGTGVTLAGLGVYNYFEGRLGQRQAASEWSSESRTEELSSTEEPVPQKLPSKPVPYYDPYRLGQTVAKLTLPRLATSLYVVEGTDQKELKMGPGHMPGTALPGVTGNCVIAGHRDTHFRVLEGIKKGDQVQLETKYGSFRYKVRSMEIVSPTNVSSLYPTDDAVLHLVTCYPFEYVGHAPKRMVIEAALLRE
jgi:sortase A